MLSHSRFARPVHTYHGSVGLDSRGGHAHNAGGKSKSEETAWEVTNRVEFGLKSVPAYFSRTSYLTCQGFNVFHKIRTIIISLEDTGRIKWDHR